MNDYAPPIPTYAKGTLHYESSISNNSIKHRQPDICFCSETKTAEARMCKTCAIKWRKFLRYLSKLYGRPIRRKPQKKQRLSHNQKTPNAILSLLEHGELSTTAIRDAIQGLNSTQAVLYQLDKLLAAGKVTKRQNKNGHRGGYAWRLIGGTTDE